MGRMNERFSADAQRVLALAQEEARFLGHGVCGSEHLLVGLIRDTGQAGQALARRGMTLDDARRAVASVLGRNDAIRSTSPLPWDKAAKTALSVGVAHGANAPVVETGHLLVGLLNTKTDRLAAVLDRLDRAATPGAAAFSSVAGDPQLNGQVGQPKSLEQRVDELAARVDRLAALVGELAASQYRPK